MHLCRRIVSPYIINLIATTKSFLWRKIINRHKKSSLLANYSPTNGKIDCHNQNFLWEKNGYRHKKLYFVANYIPTSYKVDFHNIENFCSKIMQSPQMSYLVASCAPTNNKTNCHTKETFCGKKIKSPRTVIFNDEFVIRVLLQNIIFKILLAKAKKINTKVFN